MLNFHNVSKSEIAKAFRVWSEKVGKKKGQERAKQFVTGLKTRLRLRGQVHDTDKEVSPLPTTRETWGKWKDVRNCITLSHELCIVIRAETGFDVTPDKSLSDEHNFSSLAYITSTPHGHRESNKPDEDGMEDYIVSIDRIAFRRSAPMRVKRCDVEKSGGGGGVDIGSATLVLREAVMTLIAEGGVEAFATDIAPGGEEPQRAERVTLADDPGCPGRWKILPDGDILEGSVYLPRLARAKSPEDRDILLTVDVEEAAIDVDFRATGELLEKDNSKAKARASLMNKVLALDISEQSGTLCLSRAVIRK